MTINVNSVLTKGTYRVKWSAFISCRDRWHRDVCLWHLVPSLSSTPFPFFFSCYCGVVGYVYIFPLSCLLRLFYCLKFNRILSRGIIRWAWYFFIDITSKCWSTVNFLWFKLNCRNVSGSLGKQEMLWEKEVVSDCFNNFSVSRFSQTWTSIYSSCSLLPFPRYLSYPIIEFTVTMKRIIYLRRKSL